MNCSMQYLTGSEITQFSFIHDYVQIVTDRGVISVYNPIYFIDGEHQKNIGNICCKTDIIGKKIVGIKIEEGKDIKFTLDDDTGICVSLLTKDFMCPEAMGAHLDNGTIIVIP